MYFLYQNNTPNNLSQNLGQLIKPRQHIATRTMYMPIAHRVKNKFYSLKEDFSLMPINQKCIPCDYIISIYNMTPYIWIINKNIITIFKGRVYRLWNKVLKIYYLRLSPIILDSFMMHYHGVCCIYHWLLLFYILLSIATITSIIINIAH